MSVLTSTSGVKKLGVFHFSAAVLALTEIKRLFTAGYSRMTIVSLGIASAVFGTERTRYVGEIFLPPGVLVVGRMAHGIQVISSKVYVGFGLRTTGIPVTTKVAIRICFDNRRMPNLITKVDQALT